MPVGRESQNLTCFLRLIDGCKTRADSKLPCCELHVGSSLSCIEQILEFTFWVGRQDGNSQRCAGEMSGICTRFRKGFENGFITYGDELPSLFIFGRLCTSSCVENGADYIFGQRLILKFAHRALGTNGFGYIHIFLFSNREAHKGREEFSSFLCDPSALCGK